MSSVMIDRAHNGPPRSANGGWMAAAVAGAADSPHNYSVRLLAPPPLEVPLEVMRDAENVTVTHKGQTVATGAPAAGECEPVAPVSVAVAREASTRFGGFIDHPFDTCWVCGTARPDGMRLFAGPVDPAALPGVSACVWEPPAGDGVADVWAALDCPGGWSSDLAGRPMVLGQMTAFGVYAPISGEPIVVMGRADNADGRKAFTTTSAWQGETLLGSATAVWVAVDPEAFAALRD